MPTAPADAICHFIPPFMRFLRETLAEAHISPARFQILQSIADSGPLTMVELAERLSVTKRNITTLVDGLEKDGLAVRQPHPTDRRATLVATTDAGTAVFREAAQLQMSRLQSLLSTLDDARQKDMATALTSLTEAISASAGAKR